MKSQRKKLIGIITSNKMNKTVIVSVRTTKSHPKYGKVIIRVKKYKAHDEMNACHIGDKVQIVESRPYSRHKRWSVVSTIEI